MNELGRVLLLGNYRPTVTTARRLDGLGYQVMVTKGEGGLAASSRHTNEVWEHRSKVGTPEFIDELSDFLLKRTDISIVLPLEEPYVLAVAHDRKKLPQDRVYATPDDRIVTTCLDKVAMLDLVESLGIPSAPAQVVETLDQVMSSAAAIGCPLVVRPLSSSAPILGRKALIVRDDETLERELVAWPEGHDQLIVQRFIQGPRFNVDFVAKKGKVVRAVATRVFRTDSFDGTGIDVCGLTVPMPDDLLDYTTRIAQHFNYTGVGLAQYMVDRDRNEVSFLELNPRCNGNHAVPEMAGLEFSRLIVELATDPDRIVEAVVSAGGLRHSWLFGDLRGIGRSLSQGIMSPGQVPGAILTAFRDAVTADHHIMWSRRDPWPGITQFTNVAKRLFLRGASKTPAPR